MWGRGRKAQNIGIEIGEIRSICDKMRGFTIRLTTIKFI